VSTEPFDLAAWVTESCRRQGIPLRVTDPVVLTRVGVLLKPAAGGPARRVSAEQPHGGGSEDPHGGHPGGIETGRAPGSSDDRVIEDGFHDGGLPVEVQRVPRVA